MNVFSQRIRIRPTRHDDLPFLQKLWNDGAVMRYLGYPQGMQVSESHMEQWWQMTPQARHPQLTLTVAAAPHCTLELLDGTLIGDLAYSLDAHERARIELRLTPAYWVQELVAEVLTQILRELFATTAITRVVVETTPEQPQLRNAFRQCGFHPAPTENHPHRWECTRTDYAGRRESVMSEVA